MKTFLLILALFAVALPHLIASPDNDAIVAATRTYVAANSGMTRINATVEKVEGDFARVKVTPQNAGATDPAWVFLKRANGKWTGLTLGTGFSPEDYQQFGIPKSLRVD